MFVVEKKWLGKHLLFLVLMQAGGSLCWSHVWSSDPLSSCLMTACSHYMLLPCVANGYTFIGRTTWRVLEVLRQPIGSMILAILHILNCKRHQGKTMISTLLLFSSCGKNHLENLRGHLMADFLNGEAWAFLEAIPFQPKDGGSPICTTNGGRKILGIKSPTLHSTPTHCIYQGLRFLFG